MRTTSWALISVLALSAVGCGGDSATAPATRYDTVAGSYGGPMIGITQGVALNSLFSLTVTQNAGTLGGTYGLSGTLNNGIAAVDVAGTGTITGTIESGTNPSVNFTVRPGFCPSRTAQFSGTYDSTNHRMTMTGPVQFFDQACSVVLTYQMTFILNR